MRIVLETVRQTIRPLSAKELTQVRQSIERGRPHGGDEWVRQTVKELGLEHTVRPEDARVRQASPGPALFPEFVQDPKQNCTRLRFRPDGS